MAAFIALRRARGSRPLPRARDSSSNALRRAASSPQPASPLPGGKAEPGEAFDEAAAREIEEETGLLVDPADLVPVHVIHVEQGWDQAGRFVLFVFATDTWTGEPTDTDPDKHLTTEWVTASHPGRPLLERVDLWLPAPAQTGQRRNGPSRTPVPSIVRR
ncbi:NUDIX domain-containing protein [Streptomyces sp. NPDC085463]|uniref:NUDIX domain-containing protein n=1 Tax=unclassified Streptomyces TaxID=2593676 RepID=UPI0036E999AE